MQTLLNPATFEFFATYLLAGYIVIIVRSRFVIGLQPKPAELVIEAVVFSLINQLLASLLGQLFTWFGPSELILVLAGQQDALFFGKVLVLPTLLGLLLGYNLSAGWKNAVLRRLSLPIVHPVQRAHDFAFGVDRTTGFVLVTYFDGTSIAGLFGERSLAATDNDRSDLFLESLYTIAEDGQWAEATPKRSALINLAQVRTIEFFESE